jgi:tetratricopeptide (TPR) repeat protein
MSIFKFIVWRSTFLGFCVLLVLCPENTFSAPSASAEDLFKQAVQAYKGGEFEKAAELFREVALTSPSTGALHNLGNAEWKAGRTGSAVLAWEQAQWLSPFNKNTRENLRFARRAAQLDSPELSWFEVCSTWLPPNAWLWIAFVSFWLVIAMIVLPGALRWRKSDWYQAFAAAAFVIFLLTIPAMIGIHTRTKLGVILAKEAPLRLTPTSEGQILTRLHAGESVRLERERGKFLFIRTSNSVGWMDREQLGLIASRRKTS